MMVSAVISVGYNAIIISTIVDYSFGVVLTETGYNAIIISTIVDVWRLHSPALWGYNAIIISTIVDVIISLYITNLWAIMPL